MQSIHTHLFVGGPKDGVREMVAGADADRGSITIQTVIAQAGKPTSNPDAVGLTDQDFLYERTAIEAGNTRFLFWKLTGMSLDAALASLFNHYDEGREPSGDET